MKLRILVVEDDPDVAELLEFNLSANDYLVDVESNGDKAFEKVTSQPPDLLLLDLTIPGLSGMEICKYLRENKATVDLPIIMLTARSQETDKIIGLDLGADDYITKPFSLKELLARINALIRRSKPTRSDIFEYNNLKLNFNSHKVYCNNSEIILTPTEFKLLSTFINSKGRTLSRYNLLEIVWGVDYVGEPRTVDVHIKRLRDKLGECNNIILTVKGAGYRCNIE